MINSIAAELAGVQRCHVGLSASLHVTLRCDDDRSSGVLVQHSPVPSDALSAAKPRLNSKIGAIDTPSGFK